MVDKSISSEGAIKPCRYSVGQSRYHVRSICRGDSCARNAVLPLLPNCRSERRGLYPASRINNAGVIVGAFGSACKSSVAYG
jgi:hypothetical protein